MTRRLIRRLLTRSDLDYGGNGFDRKNNKKKKGKNYNNKKKTKGK